MRVMRKGFFSGLGKKAVPPGVRKGSRVTAGLIAVGICMLLLTCLSCATAPSGVSEAGVVTVTHADDGATVEMAVGDILQIELTGTPTSGFWWHLEVLDREYCELIKQETREIASEKMEGAPILGVWEIRATKAGDTSIAMAYYRRWEGRDKASNHFSLNVHIVSEGR